MCIRLFSNINDCIRTLIDVTTVIALEVHKAITITICIACVLDCSQTLMIV